MKLARSNFLNCFRQLPFYILAFIHSNLYCWISSLSNALTTNTANELFVRNINGRVQYYIRSTNVQYCTTGTVTVLFRVPGSVVSECNAFFRLLGQWPASESAALPVNYYY